MITIDTNLPAKIHPRKLKAEFATALPGVKVRYVEPHTITNADGLGFTPYPARIEVEGATEAEARLVLAAHSPQKTEDEEAEVAELDRLDAKLRKTKLVKRLLSRLKALDGADE